jgi:site-specific DNA recombinase
MARSKAVAAAIYCRISQDRDGTELGVDRQEALCRKLATERNWQVAEVYVDNDASAFTGRRRPRYEQMLADVEAGDRDAILAVDQDRLVRRVGEVDRLIRLCEKTGTLMVLASGEIDTTTADGILKAQLLAVVAENESRKKSERVRRQRDQAAQAGRPAGGRRPFGYEADNITIRRDEAKIVRELAKRFLAGESLRQLAFDLNDREVPTWSGAPWQVTTLRSMIANPRYAGLRTHRGEVVGDATWKPILDRATHERIRAVLGDPRRVQRGRPVVHLLAGLVRCGRCGEKMHTSRRKGGARRYACTAAPAGGCGRVAIAAEPLENVIVAAVLHRLDSPGLHHARARHSGRQKDDGPDAVAELAELEHELETLAADYGQGRVTRREWFAARTPLEQRRDKARKTIDRTTRTTALDEIRGTDVHKTWEGLSLDRRRAILAAVLDRVTIRPATASRFEPDRIDVAWRV